MILFFNRRFRTVTRSSTEEHLNPDVPEFIPTSNMSSKFVLSVVKFYSICFWICNYNFCLNLIGENNEVDLSENDALSNENKTDERLSPGTDHKKDFVPDAHITDMWTEVNLILNPYGPASKIRSNPKGPHHFSKSGVFLHH